jgi:hypothetical protein
MGKPAKPNDLERDKIIEAFDRERDEVHELERRHVESVTNSRRNDRPVQPKRYEPRG